MVIAGTPVVFSGEKKARAATPTKHEYVRWSLHMPDLSSNKLNNRVMVGFWQLCRALKQIWKLKQSLIYLIGRWSSITSDADHADIVLGYFLLGDSLNTTVTVIATLQNTVVAYDTLTLTYILIVGIAAQAVGIYSFWWIQQRFRLSTKTMFNAVMIGIVLLYVLSCILNLQLANVHNSDGWGMIGIWTQKFGFHHVWEFWVYQTFYGLLWVKRCSCSWHSVLTHFSVCPWYSYSQIMVSFGFFLSSSTQPLMTLVRRLDFRGHPARQRIPLLLSFQHYRQDLFVHWPFSVQRYYRRYNNSVKPHRQ